MVKVSLGNTLIQPCLKLDSIRKKNSATHANMQFKIGQKNFYSFSYLKNYS